MKENRESGLLISVVLLGLGGRLLLYDGSVWDLYYPRTIFLLVIGNTQMMV